MTVPAINRDVRSLDPAFRHLFWHWQRQANRVLARVDADNPEGVASVVVHETRRSLARQKYLYASGRDRAGPILTRTLESNHRLGLAVDWHFERAGRAIWTPASYEWMYREVPPERYGLEHLGSINDWVHLQWRGASLYWGGPGGPGAFGLRVS